jgi:hypothetical protein
MAYAQQLAKVRIGEVPVLTSEVKVADISRNHGVVIDIQLSMSALVAAVCRGEGLLNRLQSVQNADVAHQEAFQ